MTLEEAIKHAEEVAKEKRYEYQECVAVHDMEDAMVCEKCGEEHEQLAEWLKDYKRLLEQEPCCNCIQFKRYAKQMGFSIEKESIPYLMHKEMDIPLSECQKAYNVAIDYLRRQGKVKG